ncbi:MAG: hypothetical protein IJP70_03430 [Bacteroidales bacterium]|nr:hypothetical protein [Bacteroidales bacterium]
MMKDSYLFWHPADLEQKVLELGMLPFFENGIPGFSVAEHTPSELWFSDEADGPWEWKGPLIQLGHCAYGKFFNRKAGWVSLEWLPDLLNVRRAAYPLPSEDSQQPERLIYEVLTMDHDALSRDLKREVGLGGMKLKSTFEKYMATLQMGLFACISDFEYNIDKHGNRYGWGLARYSTPEMLYGADFVLSAQRERTPEESFQRILTHMHRILPNASEKQLLKLLK